MKNSVYLSIVLSFFAFTLSFGQEENTRPEVSTDLPTIVVDEGSSSSTIDLNNLVTDSDGNTLIFQVVSYGTFQTNTESALSDSFFTYEHNGNESVSDEIAFTVSDVDGEGSVLSTESFTLSVQITPVNDSPTLPNQAVTVDEGSQSDGNIGATDPESNTLVYTVSSEPANGQVIITGSTYTYVHNGGESLSDSFQITATEVDDSSKSSTGTFTVTVSAINDSPQGSDVFGTVQEGGSQSFAFTYTNQQEDPNQVDPINEGESNSNVVAYQDSDTSQQDITFKVSSTPSYGSASFTGSDLVYTHDGSATTSDTFTYEIFDGSLSAEYTVTMTIEAVNDPPTASNDSYIIANGIESLEIAAGVGVLQNDTDEENNDLSVALAENASSGTVVLNEDGSFIYTVLSASTTDTFTYTVADTNGGQSTATVTITSADLQPKPDFYQLEEGGVLSIDASNGVLLNDLDSNNLNLVAELVTSPNAGTIELSTDGSFLYTHDSSENREDRFTYKLINSNNDESQPIFVKLDISNVNDAPIALNTSVTLNEGSSLSFLPNYQDTDNNLEDLIFEFFIPENGNNDTGVMAIDETGKFIYTHDNSEVASDLFTYTVSDGEFVSEPAEIRVTILPVNDAPVISSENLSLIVNEGGAVSASIEIFDAEGDSSSLLQVTGGEAVFGTVQISDNVITYTHDGSTNFSDSFTLRSYDGTDFGLDTTFDVSVEEVNDAPTLSDGATTSYSVDEGGSSILSLLNLFSDEEGDTITLNVSNASNGTVVQLEDGRFEYSHNGSETTTDSFIVTASDGISESATDQQINISITPVNDLPTISGVSDLNVDQFDEITFTPIINDPDDSSFTLEITNTSGSGSIEDNGDGSFTYTDSTGDSSFTDDNSPVFNFDLSVSDSENTVTEAISIQVRNISENLPQVVLRSNNSNLTEGASGTIYVSLVDNTFYSSKRDLTSAFSSYFEYVGEYEGHVYYYYTGNYENQGDWMSYSQASNLASLVGGYPVVIESAAEENYLWSNDFFVGEGGKGNQRIWLGKLYNFETTSFDWINQTTANYQNWQDSYPQNAESSPAVVMEGSFGWRNQTDEDGARLLVEFDKLTILDQDITFNITTGGGAESGIDYEAVASEITIPANSTTEVQIAITTIDDEDDEPTETINFTASADDNEVFYIKRSQSEISFDIADNDDTAPTFTIGDSAASGYTLSEADGEVSLIMSLDNPKTYETSVLFDISGTATDGEDFKAKNIGYVDDFSEDGGVRSFAQAGGKIYFTAGDRTIKSYDSTNGFLQLNTNTNWGNYTAITTNLANVKFRYIRDFDIDNNGNIYLIDDNYIRKINTDSGLVTFIAGNGNWSENPEDGAGANAKFSDPRDIAVNGDGSLIYLFDRQRIRKITFNDENVAQVVTIAGNGDWGHQDGNGSSARFADVQDIKVDSNGDLILVDNNRLRKVSGSEVSTIKVLPHSLHGLDIDSSGNYYMASRWSSKLFRYNPSEDVLLTLIDSDNNSGDVNGPISEAKISGPQEVLFTASGELLFSETNSSQIRKIDFINKVRVKAGETTGDYVLTLTDDNFYEQDEQIILTPTSSSGIDIENLGEIVLNLSSDDSLPEVQVNAASALIGEDSNSFVFTVSLGNSLEASSKSDLDATFLNDYNYLGEFEGSKYYVSRNYYNWNDSKNAAESVGGNLVVINNQEENSFLAGVIQSSVWIGFSDDNQEGQFEWVNGSNAEFQNWESGEPNNAGDEDYTELRRNGFWNDLPTHVNLPYVIEFSGVKSSIDTRVTLQVDDSSTAVEGEDSDFTSPDSLIVTIPAGEDRAQLTFTVNDDLENESSESITLNIIDVNDEAGNPTGLISSTNGSATVEILDNEAAIVSLASSGNQLNEVDSSVTITLTSEIIKQKATSVSLSLNQGDTDTAIQNKDYYIPELDRIRTIAGGQRGYKDGAASESNFNFNWKMTPFGDNGFLIADRDNHVIRLLDNAGNISTYVGNGNMRHGDFQDGTNRLEARLNGPVDIAINSENEIFIIEQWSNSISKIDTEGNYYLVANEYGQWGSDDNENAKQASFSNPRAIDFDSQGNLYVVDGEHRIRKITFNDGNASVSTYAGNGEWGENNGDRLEARFSDPKDIVFDSQDNMFIAEHNRIRKISSQGIVTTLAGSWWGENDGSFTSARFRNPTALAFDTSGNLLLTDDDHNSLRIIYLDTNNEKYGQVETIIGNNGSGFEDGDFANAKLKRPRGVVASATRVLISDTENHRIREISLQPTITIPAGETEGSITLLPIDDDVYELNETISLTIGSNENIDLTNSTLEPLAVEMISDDDAPTVRISASNSVLNENEGEVTISLRLSDRFSSSKADMEESLKSDFYDLGEFKGSKYYASKSNQRRYTYDEAYEIAQNLGGTLVIINSQQENDFITQRIFDLDPEYSSNDNRWLNHWIGYQYDQNIESWVWNNGQNIPFENWQGDQYIRNPEGRPVARLHEDGRWDNGNKDWHNQYIIEYSGAYSDVATNAGINITLDGGAEEGDFTSSIGEGITIAAGEYKGEFVLTGVDDESDEGLETITVSLVPETTEAIIDDENSSVVIQLADDDLTSVTLSTDNQDQSISEDGGSFNITATLNQPKLYSTIVELGFDSQTTGNAIFGEDYTSPSLNRVSTLTGTGKEGLIDGDISLAQFRNDGRGIVSDAEGNIFIADSHNRRIRRIDASGSFVTTVVSSDNGNSLEGKGKEVRIGFITALTMDVANQVLYFFDHDTYVIRKYSIATDQVELVAGNGQWGKDDGTSTEASFDNVSSMAYGPDGNLYFMDQTTLRKVTISEGGSSIVSTIAGRWDDGGSDDGFADQARFSWSDQKDLAFDVEGNLLIADTDNHRIRKYDLNTQEVTTIAGQWWDYADGIGVNARFKRPTGLAVDSDGNIFVSDNEDHRIRKMVLQDNGSYLVSTVAGNGNFGNINGSSSAAEFSNPKKLTVSNSQLVILDTGSASVREIQLTPAIIIQPGNTVGSFEVVAIDDVVYETTENIVGSVANIQGGILNDSGQTINVQVDSDDSIPFVALDAASTIVSEDGNSIEIELTLLDQEGAEVIWSRNDLPEESKTSFSFLGEFGGHKYYQSYNRVPYSQAYEIAIALGGQLLVLESRDENEFIGRTIRDGSWLGVSDEISEGNWLPIYGNTDYSNFDGNNNEPNGGTNENYAITWGNQWYDVNGNDNWTFIIEFGPTKSSGLDTVITMAYGGTASIDNQGEDVADYSISSQQVTIPAGSNSASLILTPGDDLLDEGIETIEISIDNIALFNEQEIATISSERNKVVLEIDDNESPDVTFALSSNALAENKGSTTLTATLSNSKIKQTEVTFNFGGEATFLDDYRSSDLGLVQTLSGVLQSGGYINGDAQISRFGNNIWSITPYTDGSYLIADVDNNAIRKINSDGSVENFIGNGNDFGNETGSRSTVSVRRPQYVTVDDNFNVYFTTDNQRVYKYDRISDRVEIIAGDGSYNYSDGQGQSSSFRRPTDIEVNSDGSLIYVLDFDNRTIRVLTRNDEGIYDVTSLVPGNHNGDDTLFTGDFNSALLGRIYELEVDWANNKIYAISNIDWGYQAMLEFDLNINNVGATILGQGHWRVSSFDIDDNNNFYISDRYDNVITGMQFGKPGIDKYADEDTGWIFEAHHENKIFKFYRLNENPSIIEAVVQIDFSSGSTLRFGGFSQGQEYGTQSAEGLITDTSNYFRFLEPGVYKIQIDTNNLSYTLTSTSDPATKGYTVNHIAGSGERAYADGVGRNASFANPGAITVNGSTALIYDSSNSLMRTLRAKTALIIDGRTLSSSVDFIAHKDQYFEGDEIIRLSIANISNGVSSTSTFDDIVISDATNLTLVEGSPFEGVQDGKVSWGDYDRDGDMDLLLMGSTTDGTITNIYRNTEGVFTNTNQNFTKFIGGDAEFVDVDQDGWLDVALSGNSPQGRLSQLYINRGEDSPSAPFFQLSTNYVVEGLSQSDMEWGDLDNDGDPDLIISGINETNDYRSIYYTNLGNYTFQEENLFFSQGKIGAEIDMFDADNDGDLDLGIAGLEQGDNFAWNFYTNSYYSSSSNYDANYNFNQYEWFRDGKTVFLDLDVDSRMDFFSMGVDNNRNIRQKSNLGVTLDPLTNPDFAFADYNNDGLNDVVITGEDEQGNPITKLYVTLGGIEFGYRLYETDINLVALRESTVDWIDYDLDGDLDLFMTGINEEGVPVSLLYQANNVDNLNTAPNKIESLEAQHLGNGLVQFNWEKPADNANTEFRYSLRVGTAPGLSDILYVNSTDTGTRLVNEPALSTLNSRELILDPGTYYASVQAIDAGNRGSVFSDEISVNVDYDWKRLNLGGIIDRSLKPNSNTQIEFVDYDRDGDMDLIGTNVGTNYTYSGAINIFGFENGVFAPTQQMGGGSATFGLEDINKNGYVDIIVTEEEQDGSRIIPVFNYTGIIQALSANGEDVSNMQPFQTGYNFQGDNFIPNLFNAKVAIQDLDSDGNKDVLLVGATSKIESEATAAIYLLKMNINDGAEFPIFDEFYFTVERLFDDNFQLEGLSYLSYDLGDIDGDNDYDFLVTGFGFEGYKTILFENIAGADDSNGELFRVTNNNFDAVREGTASFVDVDGDGLQDIVFTGQSEEGDAFTIYKNIGNIDNFPVIDMGLPGIRKSNVSWGDISGNGYIDLLYSGTIQGEGRTTRISEFNPETKIFEDSSFDVSKYLDASIAFGNFDGDADLDFVLTGENADSESNQIEYISDIYINVRPEDTGDDTGNAKMPMISLAKEGNNSGIGAPTISTARRKRVAENSYEVTVEWGGAKNKAGKPDSALTYELKLGTSKEGMEVISSVADNNGVRALAKKGNAEGNTSWKVNLPEGNYFARVQAVDASYQGSAFSEPLEFSVVSSFKLGDANGDEVVNVLDLTTNIEYIMTGIEPAAFVPEVADVNLDGEINVTDVSGIVEIILNPETSNSRIELSKAVDKSNYFSSEFIGNAELALQNGIVRLRSDKDVVALQFSTNIQAGIRMNPRLLENFTVVNFEKNDRMHYLIYSMNNQNILDVTDEIFTTGGNSKIDISNLAANTRNVGRLSIDFLDESYLEQYNNGAVFYPNPASDVATLYVGLDDAVRVEVELFNMQGSSVLQHSTERNVEQINLNVGNLSSGLYAARVQIILSDGRMVIRSLKLVIK